MPCFLFFCFFNCKSLEVTYTLYSPLPLNILNRNGKVEKKIAIRKFAIADQGVVMLFKSGNRILQVL